MIATTSARSRACSRITSATRSCSPNALRSIQSHVRRLCAAQAAAQLPAKNAPISSSTSGSSVGYRWPDSSRIRSWRPGRSPRACARWRPGSSGRARRGRPASGRRSGPAGRSSCASLPRRAAPVGAHVERVLEAPLDVLGDPIDAVVAAARPVVVGDRCPGCLLGLHRQRRLKNAITSSSGRTARRPPACVAPSTSDRTRSGWRSAISAPPCRPARSRRRAPVEADAVEHADRVVGHRLDAVVVAHGRRAADAAVVEGDDAQRAREHGDGPPPRAAAQPEAHDQQHGRAVADALPVEPRAPVGRRRHAGALAHTSNSQRALETWVARCRASGPRRWRRASAPARRRLRVRRSAGAPSRRGCRLIGIDARLGAAPGRQRRARSDRAWSAPPSTFPIKAMISVSAPSETAATVSSSLPSTG